MKYKTVADLAEAYKSGEISEDDPLWLDSDRASVWVSVNPDDADSDEEQVFGMHPEKILYEALELLGIPTDHN